MVLVWANTDSNANHRWWAYLSGNYFITTDKIQGSELIATGSTTPGWDNRIRLHRTVVDNWRKSLQ